MQIGGWRRPRADTEISDQPRSIRLRHHRWRGAPPLPDGGRTALPQGIWQAGDGFGHGSQFVNFIPPAFAVRSVAGDCVMDLFFYERIILEIGLCIMAPGVHRSLAAICDTQVPDKLAVDF